MKKIFLAGAALTALLFALVSCKTDAGTGGSSNVARFKVTYSAGTGGTLSVTLDGKNFVSGDSVEKDKVLVFTAKPEPGYKTVWAEGFVQDTANENKATITVTKDLNVTVNFTNKSFKVTYTVGSNGTVSATLYGNNFESGSSAANGATLIFTASPNSGYKTVWAEGFVQDTANENKATLTVTKETTVNVTFTKTIEYVKVSMSKLDAYLKNASNKPADDGVYYIEVTDIQAADLEGSFFAKKPSALGKILKDNGTKKVALKLPKEIPNLTYMTGCFYGCESLIKVPEIPNSVEDIHYCFFGCKNLIQAPNIPNGVEYMINSFYGCESLIQPPTVPNGLKGMSYCFYNCKSLTKAPNIPNGVKDISSCFANCSKITSVTLKCAVPAQNGSAFFNCTSLTDGSIKVPSAHLAAYKNAADSMRANKDWFAADN